MVSLRDRNEEAGNRAPFAGFNRIRFQGFDLNPGSAFDKLRPP
jgi:hypothetical protein